MKNLILLFSITFIVSTSNAQLYPPLTEQEASDALLKYWLYRWRFNNDFIKIGDLQGESLPVAERAALNQPIFKWGDGTQKLGMYLCLLATEYKLLLDNQRFEDLEKTKTELYYAIEAYRRMDCTAEWYNPYNKDPDFNWCNGYFMRGDTDVDFLEQPAQSWNPNNPLKNVDLLNQEFTDFCYDIDPNNSAIYNGPINELRLFDDPFGDQDCSEFAAQEYYPVTGEHLVNEESQDQAFCIIQGLGLVAKLVPHLSQNVKLLDGTTINYNFVLESKELLFDLIWYIKKSTLFTNTGTTFNPNSDWVIHNPNNELVARGPNAFQYSYPLVRIANQFFQAPPTFNDIVSTAFYPYWNLQQINFTGNGNNSAPNTSMQCQLAAMSNGWFALNLPGFLSINSTPFSLFAKSQDHDWEAFYLPLWSIWNNAGMPNAIKNQVFDNIYDDLRTAPCQGPYRILSQTGQNIFPHQWASVFKYFKGIDLTHNGNGAVITGFYNGNDYMLLNNFHYLVSEDPLPYFHNLIDRIIDYDVPGTMFTANTSPYNLNAFNTIIANSTVETGNEIVYRAGYEITLTPGFHAEAGVDFHAYVDPFTCVNGEYRNEGINDSTLATAYGFNEKFSFKNHGIIVYSEDESEEEQISLEEPLIDLSHLIMVYPNPSNGKFTYILGENANLETEQTVEVYNMIGDIVYSQKVIYNGQNLIELGDITSGIYIIKVISGEIVYSSKLIVE